MVTQAFCRRCGGKRNIINPEIKEVTSSRRGIMKFCIGNCEACNNRISVILPKEIPIINGKIKKLQEQIDIEKEKEKQKIEEEKLRLKEEEERKKKETEEERIRLLKEQGKRQVEQFLKQAEKNPVMIRNDLKVVKGTYYTLAKIGLILFGIVIALFLYRTIYPEYFIPNYTSDNINLCNETFFCNNTNINTCEKQVCNLTCGNVNVTVNVPDEIRIVNGSG